jgi:hypothetical protein
MAEDSEHPSIKRFHERAANAIAGPPPILDAGELRRIVSNPGLIRSILRPSVSGRLNKRSGLSRAISNSKDDVLSS